MTTKAQRTQHEKWLRELTAIPTAAACEDRVIAWVQRWVKARRKLAMKRDPSGNLIITPRGARAGRGRKPVWFTAHLDHPAFVVTNAPEDFRGREIELEFRGGVHEPYFHGAMIDIIDSRNRAHRAKIIELNFAAKPFKRIVARLTKKTSTIQAGDIGRWVFSTGPKAVVRKGLLHAPACDDLAAVAAALAALDVLIRKKGSPGNVGVLLTRAEEIGFVGAIAACKHKSIPKGTRLICLENSRSFAESPIGGGPIVRVGDKSSVFPPELTNRICAIATSHQAAHKAFKWQRKLMPGGTCEATAFATFGYQSTCLCLPLGNYHNMVAIDDVLAGRARAVCDAEFISIGDYHGLVELLVVTAAKIDDPAASPLQARLNALEKEHGKLLRE